MRARIAAFVLAVLVLSGLCTCAWGAALNVGAPEAFTPVIREAAAIFVEKTGNQVQVHPYPHDKMMEFAAKGDMDVLVSSCNHSGDIFEQKKYVVPNTRKGLFCGRMSVIVTPGNPRKVWGIGDLDRPDLKWGKITFCDWRGAKLLKGHEDRFSVVMEDAALMMGLLAQGKVDAVLGWDYEVAGSPLNPVVMRMAASKYGPEIAALIPAFVTPGSRFPKEAAALVDFLSSSVYAQDTYMRHGYMLDDGSWAFDYDTGAATRFENHHIYERVCRQFVEDCKATKGVALDIGCGPGRMTVTLAKMTELSITGVDIEPEALEITRHHAQDAGVSDRVSFVCADFHSLPFPDNYADFIISRGALGFLRDHALAMREAYRVLKPGGIAMVGCGLSRFTSPEEAKQIPDHVTGWYGVDPKNRTDRETSKFPFTILTFDSVMTRAGLSSYQVNTEGGKWLLIRK